MQNNQRPQQKARVISGRISFSRQVTAPAPLSEEAIQEIIDLMDRD